MQNLIFAVAYAVYAGFPFRYSGGGHAGGHRFAYGMLQAGRNTQGVVPLSLSPPHIDRTTQYRNSPPSLICRVAREPQFEADP
jgi:hypothetical protein